MRRSSVVIDTTLGLNLILHLTTQLRSIAGKPSAKPRAFLTDDSPTMPPMTMKTITASVDYPSKRNTQSTVTSPEKLTDTANTLNFYSISTLFDKKVAGRVINTT